MGDTIVNIHRFAHPAQAATVQVGGKTVSTLAFAHGELAPIFLDTGGEPRDASGCLVVHPETLARIQSILRKKMIDKAVRSQTKRCHQLLRDHLGMTFPITDLLSCATCEPYIAEIRAEFNRPTHG